MVGLDLVILASSKADNLVLSGTIRVRSVTGDISFITSNSTSTIVLQNDFTLNPSAVIEPSLTIVGTTTLSPAIVEMSGAVVIESTGMLCYTAPNMTVDTMSITGTLEVGVSCSFMVWL